MLSATSPDNSRLPDPPPAPLSAGDGPVGRMLRSVDFQRVLSTPPRVRSAHFSAHHVSVCPSAPAKPVSKRPKLASTGELSTGNALGCPPLVDDSPASVVAMLAGCWLGMVVPKRHARRAVTRNVLKRQMRTLMQLHAPLLAPGLWVLRLKAPFDRQQFTSPASDALRTAAHDELALLLQRAAARR